MNSLDELIRQSNILLEIIDDLLISIKMAMANDFSKTEMDFLSKTINKTIAVSKSFMENYNEFLTNQIDIEIES